MKKVSKVIMLLIIYLALSGVLLIHVSAQTKELGLAIRNSSNGYILSYSNASAGECYAVRVQSTEDDTWLHPEGDSALATCDSSNDNYLSTEVVKTSGEFVIEGLPAGRYIIYMFKSGKEDCQGDDTGPNCVKIPFTSLGDIVTQIPASAVPYGCDNRPPECSEDKFPQCQNTGSFVTCGTNANSTFSCLISNAGSSTTFCAFAKDITLPPIKASFDCTMDSRGNGGVTESCPSGWKMGYQPDPHTNACQCWPDNLPKPEMSEEAANQCPVCSGDYSYYDVNDGMCRKTPTSPLNEAESPTFDTCQAESCNAGRGCGIAKKAPPPYCAEGGFVDDKCTKVATAIGSINIDLSEFTKQIFVILLSLSGGIILFIVIRSGYILMISQGNAEKIKEAQDRLTSAAVGLLFMIFSLVILQVIGVDILHIPGFGG